MSLYVRVMARCRRYADADNEMNDSERIYVWRF